MKYPHEDVYAKADMEHMRCQRKTFKIPMPPKEVPKNIEDTQVKKP